MTNVQRGLFIAFEGGEGSGKSTQAKALVNGLTNHNIEAELTREPGGTPIGAKIRELLLKRDEADIHHPKTELMLFAADRLEHIKQIIRPALEQGIHVITDRYSASTEAYQGHANQINLDHVQLINEWATGGLKPDITFFLDIDPEIGLERAKRVEHTHFEDEDLDYHRRVRGGFMAQRDDSWITISAQDNARLTAEQISAKILDHILHVMHVIRHLERGYWAGDTKRADIFTDAANYLKAALGPDDIMSINAATTHPSCGACGRLMISDPIIPFLWYCSSSPVDHRMKVWPGRMLPRSVRHCPECGQQLTYLRSRDHQDTRFWCVNCERTREPY